MDYIIIFVAGAFAFILIVGSIYTAIISASDCDDMQRLQHLREEGGQRFPGLCDYEMLIWLRIDRYIKIKSNTYSHNDEIAELAEDYLVLNDEIQRIKQEEQQYGGEILPFATKNDSLI